MNAANYMDAEQPMAEYLATPAISAGAINRGRMSMLHMHQKMTGPEKPETPPMRLGRLIHAAILEPDAFFQQAQVWHGPKRGKEWTAFKDEHDPEWIVTAEEQADLLKMSNRVHADPTAHRLIDRTHHELSGYWTDDDYGVAKIRCDGYGEKAGILELKSTARIAPYSFQRTAAQLGYHLKCGWYAYGIERITGKRPMVHIVSVEQQAPFDVIVYVVQDNLIDMGRDEAIEIAKRYNACRLMEHFPGIVGAGEVQVLELPAWATGGEDWIPEEAQNESLA